MIYATRSNGIVSEVESLEDGRRRFDNSGFVSCIKEDASPWGALMGSMHPTTLTMITPHGPNKDWTVWPDSLDSESIESMISEVPEEISADRRLRVSKKELSTRSIDTLSKAGLNVSPRGTSEAEVPSCPEEAVARMIYGLYHLVERNTTASLKSDAATLSTTRKNKFLIVADALSDDGQVLDLTLLSTYTEPSLMMVKFFYYVATITGLEQTHDLLNRLYRSCCADQRESVLEVAQSLR